MDLPKIETSITIDPDIEEFIIHIGNVLANDYHIYIDIKEIVAHIVVEMYLSSK